MKVLSFALFSLMTSAVLANPIYSTGNATAAAGVVVTAPSFSTVLSAHLCITGNDPMSGNDTSLMDQAGACITSSAVTSSTILLLKEEVRHVEQDAYNFLAGEEMTLALAELVAMTKSEIPELENESDEGIVSLLVSL